MTTEELKQHCIRQITGFERCKEIMPVTQNDYKRYEEHKIVLQLIEAWGKVKEEIKSMPNIIYRWNAVEIIDKHLSEVENESKNENIRRNESLC